MTIACANMLGCYNDDIITIASAIEMMHMSTILHDDVIDNNDVRHNICTINTQISNRISILGGDYLFSKAFLLLLRLNDITLLEKLAKTSNVIITGEIYQNRVKNDLNLTLEQYIQIIRCKTAELFALSCQFGIGINNNFDSKIENDLVEFGLNFGIGFQIIDDLLDYIGNKSGKSIGNDMQEQRITLPVILSYANAKSEKQKQFWHNVFVKEFCKDRHEDNLSYALQFMYNNNIIEEVKQIARNYIYKALHIIDNMKGANKDWQVYLHRLVVNNIDRIK